MARETPFTVTVDMDADAAYIKMTSREIQKTVDLGTGILVDVDELGIVVGIEVLEVENGLPFDRLVTEFHVHTSDVEYLRVLLPSIAVSLMQANDGTSYKNETRGSVAVARSEMFQV